MMNRAIYHSRQIIYPAILFFSLILLQIFSIPYLSYPIGVFTNEFSYFFSLVAGALFLRQQPFLSKSNSQTHENYTSSIYKKYYWIFWSIVCLIMAEIFSLYYHYFEKDPPDYSLVDTFFVGYYLCLALSLVSNFGFQGDRLRKFSWLIDSTITTLVAGELAWVFYLHSRISFTQEKFIFNVVNLGYVTLYFMITALILFNVRGRIGIPISIFITGIILYSYADIIFFNSTLMESSYRSIFTRILWSTGISLQILGILILSKVNEQNDYEAYMPHFSMSNPFYQQHWLAIAIPFTALSIAIYIELLRMIGVIHLNTTIWLIFLIILFCIRQLLMIKEGMRLNQYLEQRNEEISHAAYHSSITGLLNRAGYNIRIKEFYESGLPVTIFAFDMNNLKFINDSYGHHAGDAAIREIATRMERIFSESCCFHLSGDEFLVVCNQFNNIQEVEEKKQVFLESMQESWFYEGQELPLSASIGTAFKPANQFISPDELQRRADQNMYEYKRHFKSKLPPHLRGR